ncbi:MAG: hypothetical protein IJT60_08415, partial [Clostridia bacterium]|nr:hypothetical protein [Clostridia bacterium]
WKTLGDTPPKSPSWWKDYNAIKHSRYDNLQKANLANLLNASAALYAVAYLDAYISNGNNPVRVRVEDFSPIFYLIDQNPSGIESAEVSHSIMVYI